MTNATDKNLIRNLWPSQCAIRQVLYFNRDADRRINAYSMGYSMVGDTSQLEVDNNGTPYYVRTLAKPISYFNRNYDFKHYKVAVLNTINGKVHVYSPNKVPKFVDVAATIQNWFKKKFPCLAGTVSGFWNATSFGGHNGCDEAD